MDSSGHLARRKGMGSHTQYGIVSRTTPESRHSMERGWANLSTRAPHACRDAPLRQQRSSRDREVSRPGKPSCGTASALVNPVTMSSRPNMTFPTDTAATGAQQIEQYTKYAAFSRTATNPNAEPSSQRTRDGSRPCGCSHGRRTHKEQLVIRAFSTRSNNQETLLRGVSSNHPLHVASSRNMAVRWRRPLDRRLPTTLSSLLRGTMKRQRQISTKYSSSTYVKSSGPSLPVPRSL